MHGAKYLFIIPAVGLLSHRVSSVITCLIYSFIVIIGAALAVALARDGRKVRSIGHYYRSLVFD